MLQNVEKLERVISVAAGAALLGAALKRRQPFGPATATALGLLARGTSGYCPVNHTLGRSLRSDDTRDVLGGSGGTRLRESVTIHGPAADLFHYWRNLRNLPTFIDHLERVDELEHGRSHWVFRGPGGTRLEWDAELVNEIEPDLLAWRTLSGADLVSAGSVRFRPRSRGRTDVIVTMQYEPAAGKCGAALGWLTGYRPSAELREDLERFKALAEHGALSRADAAPSWETARRVPIRA